MAESSSFDTKAIRVQGLPESSRIEKSIERKRTYTSSLNPKDLEDFDALIPEKLFEHIMIVGAAPDGESTDPRLLFLAPAYPLLFKEEEFDHAIQFCFPAGLKPHGREYSRQNMLITQFTFRISGINDVYGVCCQIVINPRRVPFFVSERTLNLPFCFCILTRNPVLSVHFQYLTYLAMLFNRVVNPAERPKAVVAVEAAGPSISYLTVEKNTARWPNTRFVELFSNELLFLGTVKADPNRDRKFQLSEKMKLVIPHLVSENENLANPCLDVLFSNLSVPDIVRLYAALLLEHHTIFKSKKLHKVTNAVLAARAILSPFRVESTLLPIIPNNSSFLPLLESPVPYICGLVASAPIANVTLPEQLCIVDLDKKTVTDAELKVDVPRHKELIDKLNKVITDYEDVITYPSKTASKQKYNQFFEAVSPFMRPIPFLKTKPQKYVFFPAVVEAILGIFSNHFSHELENLKACFVTDSTDLSHPITVFNKDLFLASVTPDQENFYEMFINTTMFQQYCEGKTDEMQTKKAQMSGNSDGNPLLS